MKLFSLFVAGLLVASSIFADAGQDLGSMEDQLQASWSHIIQQRADARKTLELYAETLSRNPQKAQEVADTFDRLHQPFFENMDAYIMAKYDHFIHLASSASDRIHEELFAGGNAPKRLTKLRTKMAKAKSVYEKNRDQFGKGRDNQRTHAFREFFKAYEHYILSIDAAAHYNHVTIGKAKAIVHAMRFVKLAPRVPMFFWDLYQPNSLQTPDQTTPLMNRLFGSIFAGIGEVDGYKVNVMGRENIVKVHPKGEITVYVPNHATRIPDQVSLAETGIQDFNIMTNFAIPGLTKRAAGLATLTMVGNNPKHKEDPTSIVIRLAKESRIHTFVIYPQGASTGGLLELMGVRESFITGVVMGLQNEGLAVRIVPVSYPKNAFILNKADPSRELEAIIHKAIDPAVVEALTKGRDPQLLARVIRALWQQDQVIDGDLFRLQPRTKQLKELLKESITRGVSALIPCGPLLSSTL